MVPDEGEVMTTNIEARTRTLATQAERKGQCRSFMEFGDDFGDNTTTFHCELAPKHKGQHIERGTLHEQPFEIRWGKVSRKE